MAETLPPDDVTLSVAGRIHRGWTAYSLDLSLDNLAHAFSLDVTERWIEDDGSESAQWIAAPGDACEIAIGGEALFSGWIDAVEVEIGAEDRTITLSGRSKTADLVDCAAVHSPGSWSQRPVLAIASEICQPFGITAELSGDAGKPVARFAIEPGESAFEAIERLCRMRGLLAWSPDGAKLVLGRGEPQGAVVRIAEGSEFTRLAASHDASQRFSAYAVKGQMAGNDSHNGKAVSQPKGSASDPGITRYRPYVVIAEDSANNDTAAARARWEAAVRAARSQSVTAEMPSHRAPDGALWGLLRPAELAAPRLRASGTMLVSALRFSKDAQSGTATQITLTYPGAWTPEPLAADASAARIGGSS